MVPSPFSSSDAVGSLPHTMGVFKCSHEFNQEKHLLQSHKFPSIDHIFSRTVKLITEIHHIVFRKMIVQLRVRKFDVLLRNQYKTLLGL